MKEKHMDALQCLYSRVSTRDFNDKPVSSADVAEIVRAAGAAPVGMCRYADKHLTVVKNEAFFKAVTAKTPQVEGRSEAPFYGARTLIVVSSKLSDAPAIEYADAACIVYAMALAARAKNVASVYLWGFLKTVRADEKLLAALDLPEGYSPISALAIGYTDEELKLSDAPRHTLSLNEVD